MEIEVGAILEGKVTGITKFGAFVSLPGGRSGLVHISEIAYSYVNDVTDHLSEGQEVKVKVISVDDSNRINLSIKKAMDPPPRPPQEGGRQGGYNNNRNSQGGNFTPRQNSGNYAPRQNNGGGNYAPRQSSGGGSYAPRQSGGNRSGGYNSRPQQPAEPDNFEDRLKSFMQSSDSKLSEMRYLEKKGSRRGTRK